MEYIVFMKTSMEFSIFRFDNMWDAAEFAMKLRESFVGTKPKVSIEIQEKK